MDAPSKALRDISRVGDQTAKRARVRRHPHKVTLLRKARGAALERVYRGNASFRYERETDSQNCRNAFAVKSICGLCRRANTPKQTVIGRCEITEVRARFEATVASISLQRLWCCALGPVRSIMLKRKSAIGGPSLASSAHIFRALRPAVRLILIGSSILLTAGCATISPRNVLPQASASQIEVEGFHNIRFWGDASGKEIQLIMMADAPQADTRRSLGPVRHPPVSNLLAISGGAEDGAFGAGLLVGWSDAGTRPPFDLVTGISSGALIAPFAFLGRGHDSQLREIFTKKRKEGRFYL